MIIYVNFQKPKEYTEQEYSDFYDFAPDSIKKLLDKGDSNA